MKIASKILGPAVAAAAIAGGWNMGDACTRVVYHGADSLFVVARSLDWKTPIPTNLYVYPRAYRNNRQILTTANAGRRSTAPSMPWVMTAASRKE